MLRPTDEQQVAVEKFLTGAPLKIAAFAGAGKTTTLRMLAGATPRRGIYLAFNRAIATEARDKFPRSVECRTTHALAFRAVLPQYGSTAKLTKTLHAKQLAAVLNYAERIFSGALRLDAVHQAHLVLGTVRRYCQSGEAVIGVEHVPRYLRLLGAGERVIGDVRAWAVVEATALWRRMVDARNDIPLGHDGYLKLWALAQPALSADYILLDEAQDTNEVVLGVLARQRAQVVYVGDRHQQIYEWRGAVNAMEKIDGCDEATLTQSFRFGAEIASAASRVLATLGERRQIRGMPDIDSMIVPGGNTDVILARTNATVILEVLEATQLGRVPCICGGTQEIKRLLSDVYELKAGKPAVSPEFFGFRNWMEVVKFANSEEGESLRTFVQMVEQNGEAKLWAAIKKVVADENDADVILSTAHKAKGREWNSVRLAPDFMSARLGPTPEAASEVRLFYVAMTRAKRVLVAEPALLQLFTTDAWKRKRPDPPKPFTSAQTAPPPPRPRPQAPPRSQPRASPRNMREVSGEAVRARHPGAPRAGQAAPSSPRWPPPAPANPPRAAIREVTPQDRILRHPGAVAGDATSGTTPPRAERPVAPEQASPERMSLWRRVTRLFGG